MAFATLHRINDEGPVYVNPKQVVYVASYNDLTVIGLTGAGANGNGRSFTVTEAPEEAIRLLDAQDR